MLKIAILGEYSIIKKYVVFKYKDRIREIRSTKNTYILLNGDELILCYGEPSAYRGMEFDAYVVVTQPETLEDVIKFRCSR